ncbi:MAG: phytoene desaturase family protein, partial [Betaproteobacteria bacterium]
MAASDPIVVIGGGLGGLASAIVLRARGYPVILFEHNQWLGGKAAELRLDGFRFDMGPTVLTVPSVLTRIFEEAGRNAHEVLDLVRLNPQWRCFFEDGSVLDLVEDTGAMSRKIEEYAPGTGSGDGYRRLLELSRKLHDISQRFFFWRSVEGLADTMDLKASLNAATMRDVLNLRMGATVAGTIRRHVPDERVAQMLDHFVQYVGSSPFNSPAVL